MSRQKIFISYAHQDRDAASAIASALKNANLEPWIDESRLSPGQNWITEIDKALAEAGYLLALLSTSSLQSVWVRQEWTAMLSRQLGGTSGGLIIPLRLENVEPPLLLRPLQSIDLFRDFNAGVQTLVGFLLNETLPVVLAQPTAQFSNDTRKAWNALIGREPLTEAVLGKLDNRTIRLTALRCVTRQDLLSFCIDSDTDSKSIGGNTLNETILSLLEILIRESRLEDFIRWLAEEKARCVRAAIQQYMPEIFAL